MADEAKWYFAKNGQPHGPVSEHDLCKQREAGAFGADDYVYCKGETDGWVKASAVNGLCDELALDPEPTPEHHEVPLYERAAYQQPAAGSKGHKGEKK